MKALSPKSALALLMALVLAFSMAACGGTPEPVPDEDVEKPTGKVFVNNMPRQVGANTADIPPLVDLVLEKAEENEDTVGWLQIPGTTIDDVVVWYPDPPASYNSYYYRLNFKKEKSQAGVFYADSRCTFGEDNQGSLEDMANNTTIYGHTLSTDIDGVMFAPLKYFEQEDFAKKTPYIYFSTRDDDHAWEVFAVFYGTVYLPYNRPDLDAKEWEETLSECVKRSIYTYDTQVSAEDKVITLSTCTYSVPGLGSVGYPNDYRFVIMAKQVDRKDATKTVAEFEVNPEPKEP